MMVRDWLTTGECARVLCVTTGYIRGEIEDERLEVIRIERPHGRAMLRIEVETFRFYLLKHSPDALPRLDSFLALRAA